MSLTTPAAGETSSLASNSLDPSPGLPLAHVMRIELARSRAQGRPLDLDGIIDAMSRDGHVSGDDLAAFEGALLTEVAAGRLPEARARQLMDSFLGQLGARAALEPDLLAGPLAELVSALSTLGVGTEQLDAFVDQAEVLDAGGEVRRAMSRAAADGTLTPEELRDALDTARSRDASGGLTLDAARGMYDGLVAQLRAGVINRTKYDQMVAQVDAALLAKVSNDAAVDPAVREFVISRSASHALESAPRSTTQWKAAIDMMVFDSAPVDGRRLSDADIIALGDHFFASTGLPTNSQAAALGAALAQARDDGLITEADYARAASQLNRRIGEHRLGANAPADFDVLSAPRATAAEPAPREAAASTPRATRGASTFRYTGGSMRVIRAS